MMTGQVWRYLKFPNIYNSSVLLLICNKLFCDVDLVPGEHARERLGTPPQAIQLEPALGG